MLSLWQIAFPEDDIDDVQEFFTHFLTPDTAFVMRDGERLVSMAFLLPASLEHADRRYSVGYIYAGATHPFYRGLGCYRRLLEHIQTVAAQRGVTALFLRPADEALANSYRRMGYVIPLTVCRTMPCTAQMPYRYLDANEYTALRRHRLKEASRPFIDWAPEVVAQMCTWCRAVQTREGTVALLTDEDTLTVAEVLAPTQAPIHEIQAGLLKPIQAGVFKDVQAIYMGYGLE